MKIILYIYINIIVDFFMPKVCPVKKFKSSMTLFDAVSPNDIFAKALESFYGGERDNKTLEKITL